MRTSLKESADDYPHVVIGPIGKVRIIRCRDDIQFIMQRRETCNGKANWRGVWFFRTVLGVRFLPEPSLREAAAALFDPPDLRINVPENEKEMAA
jgi:hypothetical protein